MPASFWSVIFFCLLLWSPHTPLYINLGKMLKYTPRRTVVSRKIPAYWPSVTIVTSEVSTKKKLDGICACSWGKFKRWLSKCIRRTNQDWFKCLAIYKASMPIHGSTRHTRQTMEAESLPQREEQKNCQQHRQIFVESM